MKIPDKHSEILQILHKNGFKSYIVGGAVRDYLMNKHSIDFDIATSAKPYELKDILSKTGYKIKEVGESFNVIMVDDIEIATFRKDRYFGLSDKNVEITYADSIEEDLERRDFTMNSIAYDFNYDRFIDPFDGIKDISNNILRFTGDPILRIHEDPCRILRACRFSALRKDVIVEFNTFSSLYFSRDLVNYVNPERIRLEILKAMNYEYASNFFIMLNKTFILEKIFPTMQKCYGLNGGYHHDEEVFDHLMLAGDFISTKKPLLKLVGYLHDVGKSLAAKDYSDIEEIHFYDHDILGAYELEKELKALKFSNEEIHYIISLVSMHMRTYSKTPKAVRRTIRDMRNLNIPLTDLVRLKIADRHANLRKPDFTDEEIKEFVLKLRRGNKKVVEKSRDLAINGFDIMNIMNLKQGKEVGLIINELMEYVLEYPEKNVRTELIQYLLNKIGEQLCV